MKRLLLLIFMLLGAISSWSVTITIGTGTSTGRYPLDDYYVYSRSQCLYLSSEITTGGIITNISWYRNDVGADPNAIGTTEIWLMETTNTVLTGTTWEGPGTLVATISNIDLGPGGGWVNVPITNFNYSGSQNLLVSVYTQNAPYTAPHSYWRYTSTSTNYRARLGNSDTSNPPTMALSYFRPNIQFVITAPPCSGTPDPGNTLTTANPVCPGVIFTLSLQNVISGDGVTYQWQTSSTGSDPWTNVGTSATTFTTSQTSATYYQCQVTCTNSGQTGTSTPLQVMMNPFYSCYCTSIPSNIADEDIYSVTISGNTIAYDCNTTAPGPGSILKRYSNFTTLGPIADLYTSGSVPFSIHQDECDGATYYSNALAIWIDFNQDGDFIDAGENVYLENALTLGPRTISGTIAVPAGATLGLTGMRIIDCETYYGATLVPCLSYSYGETEDYVVNIKVPTSGLTGYVYDYNGNPLEGATVEVTPGGLSTISGADGSYLLSPIPDGSHQFKCSKLTYNDVVVDIDIPFNANANYNFTLLNPEISVDPTSIFAVLTSTGTATFNLEITNDGNGILDWQAVENVEGPCIYTIRLEDTYGDGWNGGVLDVLVDGAVKLDNITLPNGHGPLDFTIDVFAGQEITTLYTPGGWPYENYYTIFDQDMSQVWLAAGSGSTGPPDILPGQLIAPTSVCYGDVDWISLDNYTGQVDPFGGTQSLILTLDAAATPPSMAPGVTYDGDILFTSPNGLNFPIHITLVVTDGGLKGPEELTPYIVDQGNGDFMLKWKYFTLRDMQFTYFAISRNGEIIGTSAVSSYKFKITEPGSYCYRVYAVYENGAVYSDPSNEVCITYPLAPGVPVSNWALVMGAALILGYAVYMLKRRA